VVLGAVAVAVAYEETPVPTEAMAATSFAQSVVYSSNGTLIGRFGTTNRQMLTYNQIPQSIINAVLAAEDRNFFNEGGISPTGIVRAAYEDATGNDGSLQGGSTITQEFVRNYYSGIGTQQTFSRKIKEIFVAMKVAKEKSKQWILANYLNTIYLGEGAYGIGRGRDVFRQAGGQADRGAGRADRRPHPAAEHVPAAAVPFRAGGPLALRARRHGADGHPDRAAGRDDEVPGSFGDHVPQTVGSAVWDPYILDMVYTELENTYHFTQSQIYDGGYVIRTSIDDSKMKALYQAVSQNEAQIDEDGVYPFQDYMHAGAVLENPANGAIQALYPGPGYPGSKSTNGTGHVLTASASARRSTAKWNMATYRTGSRSAPRSSRTSWPPRSSRG
jgi:membrane peptidoglycan carboxypeptidase